jgi:hypothetical protein
MRPLHADAASTRALTHPTALLAYSWRPAPPLLPLARPPAHPAGPPARPAGPQTRCDQLYAFLNNEVEGFSLVSRNVTVMAVALKANLSIRGSYNEHEL